MAELTGWPTDGAEGSVSSEARWRKMGRLWVPSGVASGLVPSLGAGVINVSAGSAWVDGHFCELTSPASESSTANGLLVVRFTPADNSFELVYRDGATAPTQSDAVWELPIALMTAGALTDVRQGAGPVVAYKTAVANQTGISAETNVTGLTATFFPVSGRRYKLSALLRAAQQSTAGIQTCRITDGANVSQIASQIGALAANEFTTHSPFVVVTPPGSPVTYKVRLDTSSGTVNTQASALAPAVLLIEDAGPA